MKMLRILCWLLLGAFIGAAALYFFQPQLSSNTADTEAGPTGEPEPLYWVAPMDANYRRDEPGKSPMGMDLVPVYAEDEEDDAGMGAGTVRISPEVVQNLGVRTAEVQQNELQPEIRTVGYLQYNQDAIVHIHPRVEGWVEESFIHADGDPVEQGQPLYDLYSPALVNAQEELVFGLSRGDQRLVRAAEQRLRALQVGQPFIDQLKRDRKVSQTIRFYAPTSGVVDELNIREGFFVEPGMTLMAIASLEQIWLVGEVFERQADWVKTGLPVDVSLDSLPAQCIRGEVDYIYPSLDADTRTLKVRVRLDNPDHRLKPNMFAELRIHTEGEQALLAPKEAVIRSSNQDRVVLALGEGRFKSVHVTTGRRDGQFVEIVKGLQAGDRVVTSAQFLIDSESSKSSDFKRMHMGEDAGMSGDMADMDMSTMEDEASAAAEKPQQERPAQVWIPARINSVDPDKGKLNANHDPVPEWQWPSMTMDFDVAVWVELPELPLDTPLHLQVSRLEEGGYQVTDVHVPEAADAQQSSE